MRRGTALEGHRESGEGSFSECTGQQGAWPRRAQGSRGRGSGGHRAVGAVSREGGGQWGACSGRAQGRGGRGPGGHRAAGGVASADTAQHSTEVLHTHFRKLINEVLLLHDLEL